MTTNTNSIYTQYFTYTNDNYVKYGEKTIVLLQVGAFFEVYGIKNISTNNVTNSNIVEFAEICQLNVSEKSQSYQDGQIVMAGFRDFTIDKYITKLTDAGYTVPVYIQIKNGTNITRPLYKVYSTGTYVSCETDSLSKISNNIMCIWFEIYKPMNVSLNLKDTIVYGVSVVDIFTGKTSMFQHETAFYMNVTTFDELERYISMFNPSELIIISPFDNNNLNDIFQFTGIKSSSIHKIDSRENHIKITNCSNQKYIKTIIASYFNESTYDGCSEFSNGILSTQSFCYLLDFIYEHNPDLVRKITLPVFNNTSDRMVLANHTLLQLNIISDMSNDCNGVGNLSSVLSLLNKCCSPMGKRKFKYQITNPTFNIEWLNQEYNMIGNMLCETNYCLINTFRKQLVGIRDLNKVCRQLLTKSIYPSTIFHLYNSIQLVSQMNVCLGENREICNYLCNDFLKNDDNDGNKIVDVMCTELTTFLNEHFIIQNCKLTSSMTTFVENIIQTGVSIELDNAILQYDKYKLQFNSFYEQLNKILQDSEHTPNIEYVKVHETDKSGMSLQITSKRSKLFNKVSYKKITLAVIIDDADIPILLNDIKFIKASASNVEVEHKELTNICRQIQYYKNNLNSIIAQTYLVVLDKLEKTLFHNLENISSYVATLDVLQSKTYVAKTLHYCKPVIGRVTNAQSYIKAHELRHCLIEHIQQNELYVTNDIHLCEDGVLLYGTNAVGKTSLIRALGVSVIMAQTGMYVPCTSFEYYPYTAVFSRIIGNDNLFKGLSTFAVEMSELRIILKMADSNSLILGDELCSGTETESALSIFVAGLMEIHKKRSSFIFATHFHEIVKYDEIQQLTRLNMKHMAVEYNPEKDCLVYDRKLKPGSGPRIYGLEVCKSLHLDTDFLDLAYTIRNKYYPETQGILSSKPSVYNSQKLRSLCEMCKNNMSQETHHILPQKNADSDGFIGTIHKNHKANLMALCEKCHDKMHFTK